MGVTVGWSEVEEQEQSERRATATLTLTDHIRGSGKSDLSNLDLPEHPLPHGLRTGALPSLTCLCLCRAWVSAQPYQSHHGEHVQTLWFSTSLSSRSLSQHHLFAIPTLPRPSQSNC